MSNLGKLSIIIPSRVIVSKINYGNFYRLSFTNPENVVKSINLPLDCKVVIFDGLLSLHYPASGEMWGTVSQSLRQMLLGITDGFSQTLNLSGIGYKASCTTSVINLSLGYSHDINIPIPVGVRVSCPNSTTITLQSSSKLQLTAFAHRIAAFRPAIKDRYKKKGILLL